MRVTNNMIMTKANTNINGTKVIVDKENTQMTTQKKIDRPSEDPVVAVRSLRLATQLAKIDQYYEKNIPDAESWMDVTESALKNMKEIIKDVHSLSVQGSNDPLTQTDRNTILSQLKALQQELYSEGNADYAGRTVFTGYRTNKTLTFMTDEKKTSYNVEQSFKVSDAMEKFRYFSNEVQIPSTETQVQTADIAKMEESDYTRIRMGYNDITSVFSGSVDANGNYIYKAAPITGDTFDIHVTGTDPADPTGATKINTTQSVKVYETEADWLEDTKTKDSNKKNLGEDDVIFVKETGELIFGDNIAATLKSQNATLTMQYNKTGFSNGELRPEYYYNCTDVTDEKNPIRYDKYDAKGEKVTYEINYTIAANQDLAVNIEADEVFDTAMYQDIQDMIDAVSRAINAHDKIDKLTKMKEDDQFASALDQSRLQEWLEAAQREADYADNHMSKVYNENIGRSDAYAETISLATTKLGCKADQLLMTKKRMSDQQETVQELQSSNDDVDLSDIVLKYTAAYTAYQSSLTAAGRLGSVNLLNYI